MSFVGICPSRSTSPANGVPTSSAYRAVPVGHSPTGQNDHLSYPRDGRRASGEREREIGQVGDIRHNLLRMPVTLGSA